MTAKEFVERFLEVQRELGYARTLLPTAVVGAWRDFVDECERGYAMSIYEYDNDLSDRLLIERLLHDEQLAAMPELDWVRAEVEELDRRFRELLLPVLLPHRSAERWWAAHPPRRGGAELAADIRSTYGIDIEVVDT